tara:strand:- start:200 stop:613 length:414 start_codon:yes stop_codon:yes gene_type:complete
MKDEESTNSLEQSIKMHEGLVLHVYLDVVGVPTIGFGRNLNMGISEEEALFMLRNDLKICTHEAEKYWFYNQLSPARKEVIVEMIYNLGAHKLRQFKKMLYAIEQGDFKEASYQMLESKWSSQVGKRAITLSKKMFE